MKTFIALAVLLFFLPADGGTGAKIISTQEVEEMLKTGNVSVMDLRSDLPEYLKGHIPQAAYLHFETLRILNAGVPAALLSGEAYAALFSRLGVKKDKPVVIYSAGESNNFYATFVAWLLTGLGHPSVFTLDGGYEKWVKEKRAIAREYPAVETTSFPSTSVAFDVVALAEVKRAVETKDALLVDARPLDQFEGRAGAQMRLGHIPGAIHHFWASDLVQTETGKVWKPVDELRASYEKQGITPDKDIITYCNTGTEATHLYFALKNVLGYPKVRVYVPSFTEWAAIPDLPVVRVEAK